MAKKVKKLYKKQRNRGSDGFGYYLPDTNKLSHNPREGRTMTLLRREKEATEILFHHRFPTSTVNVRNACHPFSTKSNFEHNYVGVHNGVLWNEKYLKQQHKDVGIEYVSELGDGSFNDSEALIYDIARYIEGEVKELTARGSIAFIVVQRDTEGNPRALYFGRNSGNPLMMVHTKKTLTLSSEGYGAPIKENRMYRFDYKTHKLTSEACTIPTSSYHKPATAAGYSDFTDEDWRNYDALNGYDDMDDSSVLFKELDLHKNAYHRLLAECNYDKNEAILLGELELDHLIEENKKIKDKVDVYENANQAELERYNSIDDEIWYLSQAVETLRKEASGIVQMGFRLPSDTTKRVETRHQTYIEKVF